jgi:hypothetical protein
MNQPNDTPEPSLASAGSLPEAWAVEWKGDTKIDRSTVCYTEDAAKRKADECPGLDGVAVPLYRAPTLTDKERAAIEWAAQVAGNNVYFKECDTLRALLARLK